jgi:hypothetical protein
MKPEGNWKAGGKPRIDIQSCLTLVITVLAVTAFWVAFIAALYVLTNNWR